MEGELRGGSVLTASPTSHPVLQRGLSAPESARSSPNTSRLSRHLSPESLGSSPDSPSYIRSLWPPENLLSTQQPTGDDPNTNPSLSTPTRTPPTASSALSADTSPAWRLAWPHRWVLGAKIFLRFCYFKQCTCMPRIGILMCGQNHSCCA